MIYFDNSATTMQKPAEVGQAVCEAINSFGGTHAFNLTGNMLDIKHMNVISFFDMY